MVSPQSLMNCHAVGLDSIILADRVSNARGMVRVFVARPDHELWRNNPASSAPMSIGLHGHHCDITMVPLFGTVFNVFVAQPWCKRSHAKHLRGFDYKSPIQGGNGFSATGASILRWLRTSTLVSQTFLEAEREHTVFVPKGLPAAWLILEGRENPFHSGTTWSNDDLTAAEAVPDYLYRPMTPARLAENMALLAGNGASLG